MSRPLRPPIGRHLASVSRAVSRAFDEVLAEAVGSLPAWLVLIAEERPAEQAARESGG